MKRVMLVLVIVCSLPLVSHSQFRVVGYVSAWAKSLPAVTDSTLQKLTHLNIAFVNPDSTGTLVLPSGFDSLILQAHASKVKVLMSMGGGSFNPYFANLLSKPNRKNFVDQIVQLANEHQLDGIDVDLEGEAIDANYDAFIADLSAALKPSGKLLTSALATWNAQLISTASLKKFDFINIMSYDQTGPWRPQEPGPHSTYVKAEEELHYWTSVRGFPKKKINLGLPFYGYCFGTSFGESMSYGTIISKFEDSWKQDMVVPPDGGIIHYNGLPTIQAKTALAMKSAGGVMIWQILQDAEGERSLLTSIDQVIHKTAVK